MCNYDFANPIFYCNPTYTCEPRLGRFPVSRDRQDRYPAEGEGEQHPAQHVSPLGVRVPPLDEGITDLGGTEDKRGLKAEKFILNQCCREVSRFRS